MNELYPIFLSGISGAGKNTIAKEIVNLLNSRGIPSQYIDQDWYVHTLTNWDHEDSTDHEQVSQKINEVKKSGKNIVVAGFALRKKWFSSDATPAFHIHIKKNSC